MLFIIQATTVERTDAERVTQVPTFFVDAAHQQNALLKAFKILGVTEDENNAMHVHAQRCEASFALDQAKALEQRD